MVENQRINIVWFHEHIVEKQSTLLQRQTLEKMEGTWTERRCEGLQVDGNTRFLSLGVCVGWDKSRVLTFSQFTELYSHNLGAMLYIMLQLKSRHFPSTSCVKYTGNDNKPFVSPLLYIMCVFCPFLSWYLSVYCLPGCLGPNPSMFSVFITCPLLSTRNFFLNP